MSTALLLSTCLGAVGCSGTTPVVHKPVEVVVERLAPCKVTVELPSLIDDRRATTGTEYVRVLRENIKRQGAYIVRADKALAECRGEKPQD